MVRMCILYVVHVGILPYLPWANEPHDGGFCCSSGADMSAAVTAAAAAAWVVDAVVLSCIARYSATVGFRCDSAAFSARLLALSLACSWRLMIAGTQPQSQLAAAPALCSFFGWPNGVKLGSMVRGRSRQSLLGRSLVLTPTVALLSL